MSADSTAAVTSSTGRSAAPSPAPDAATPAQPAIPLDPMAALAAELTRSLGKAA